MTDITSYLRQALLRHTLRNTYWTPPPFLFVALFNSATDKDGNGLEVTFGGYQRQFVFFGFPNAEDESASLNEPRFGPASENWGEVTHFAIYDQQEGGNMLLHGPVDNAVAVDAGDIYVFDIGGVIVFLR